MNDIYIDLQVVNGDFAVMDSLETIQQTQTIILQSDKGKIINSPLLGVCLTSALNGVLNKIQLNSMIRKEMIKDNIQVNSVNVIGGEIYVKSKYKI